MQRQRVPGLISAPWLCGLFFMSGASAIIYQVIWQRALYTAIGINLESVTIIVSVFMFGLGTGALLGGELSHRLPKRLPLLFLIFEWVIGLFGSSHSSSNSFMSQSI